jgi:hypothetical protein
MGNEVHHQLKHYKHWIPPGFEDLVTVQVIALVEVILIGTFFG